MYYIIKYLKIFKKVLIFSNAGIIIILKIRKGDKIMNNFEEVKKEIEKAVENLEKVTRDGKEYHIDPFFRWAIEDLFEKNNTVSKKGVATISGLDNEGILIPEYMLFPIFNGKELASIAKINLCANSATLINIESIEEIKDLKNYRKFF